MLLLQFTDTHLPEQAGASVRGVAPDRTLARCIAHAAAHHPLPDALLLTGDLVQDAPPAYSRLRDAFGGSRVPVHVLPGNHDESAGLRQALAGQPFVHALATRYGPWLLVMLDTTVAGRAHGHLAEAELGRLDEALAAHPDAHALVCLHHHPVPHGSRWLDTTVLDNAAALFAVLARHAGVRALLWGHVHQAFDGRQGRWRLLSTPSTCTQFLPGSDDFAVDTRPPGYRWLRLEADGSLDTGVEWVAAGD